MHLGTCYIQNVWCCLAENGWRERVRSPRQRSGSATDAGSARRNLFLARLEAAQISNGLKNSTKGGVHPQVGVRLRARLGAHGGSGQNMVPKAVFCHCMVSVFVIWHAARPRKIGIKRIGNAKTDKLPGRADAQPDPRPMAPRHQLGQRELD